MTGRRASQAPALSHAELNALDGGDSTDIPRLHTLAGMLERDRNAYFAGGYADEMTALCRRIQQRARGRKGA
jgi:hypothetical protein